MSYNSEMCSLSTAIINHTLQPQLSRLARKMNHDSRVVSHDFFLGYQLLLQPEKETAPRKLESGLLKMMGGPEGQTVIEHCGSDSVIQDKLFEGQSVWSCACSAEMSWHPQG